MSFGAFGFGAGYFADGPRGSGVPHPGPREYINVRVTIRTEVEAEASVRRRVLVRANIRRRIDLKVER